MYPTLALLIEHSNVLCNYSAATLNDPFFCRFSNSFVDQKAHTLYLVAVKVKSLLVTHNQASWRVHNQPLPCAVPVGNVLHSQFTHMRWRHNCHSWSLMFSKAKHQQRFPCFLLSHAACQERGIYPNTAVHYEPDWGRCYSAFISLNQTI